jgi:hypothetical protein
MKKINYFKWTCVLFNALLLIGCDKEEPSNNPVLNSFLVKSITLYEGDDLNVLEISSKTTLEYSGQNQLVSKKIDFYQNGTDYGSLYYYYNYYNKLVVESDFFEEGSQKIPLRKTYFKLNDLNHVVEDSTVDLTDNSTWVIYRTYNDKHQRIYRYSLDTLDGGVFEWVDHNVTKEYLMNGLMGRFLIMSHEYGSKKNTINMGEFWLDGEKSEFLPEKSVEPNYEYHYTYKMELDGFVSEKITAISSPGGVPYRYEKFVYTR